MRGEGRAARPPKPPRVYTQAEFEAHSERLRLAADAKRAELEAQLAEVRAQLEAGPTPAQMEEIEAAVRADWEPKIRAVEMRAEVAAYLHGHNIEPDLAVLVMVRNPPESAEEIPRVVEETRRECPDLFARAEIDRGKVYRPDWNYVTGRH